MRCVYCGKTVFGTNGVTVPNMGPAHESCFQAHETMRRKFRDLDITDLSDNELSELKELVIAEENHRNRGAEDEVELF